MRGLLLAGTLSLVALLRPSSANAFIWPDDPDCPCRQTYSQKKHSVIEGDTLWALSRKYTGDPYNWEAIADYNNIKDPRDLRIGMLLKIPPNMGENNSRRGSR